MIAQKSYYVSATAIVIENRNNGLRNRKLDFTWYAHVLLSLTLRKRPRMQFQLFSQILSAVVVVSTLATLRFCWKCICVFVTVFCAFIAWPNRGLFERRATTRTVLWLKRTHTLLVRYFTTRVQKWRKWQQCPWYMFFLVQKWPEARWQDLWQNTKSARNQRSSQVSKHTVESTRS